MSKTPWRILRLAPVILGTFSVLAHSTLAAEVPVNKVTLDLLSVTTDQSTQMPNALAQVTSVSQLSDVQPTDWAFQALQSLVERYGVIAGYPDGTFRGNRAMTRYEFAAGLNAALNRVDELIATDTANLVKKEDLATLQQLQAQFATELATLRGRVDALEASTSELEANQFSTTTKLNAEVIFAPTAVFGNKKADGSNEDVNENVIFSERVRLNFDTSFTGRDILKTRLEASNTPELKDVTGTDMGRLAFDEDTGNQLDLSILEYSFPLGEKTIVRIAPRDELYRLLDEDVEAVSPLEDDGNGSISRFGRFNPIFRLGGEEVAGASISYEFSEAARLSLAYMGGGESNNPSSGLFGGAYIALAQLTLEPINNLALGLTYAHSYSANGEEEQNPLETGTGSTNANNPFADNPTSANSYGVEAAYRASSAFTLAGWAGFTDAHAEGGSNQGADANIFNWAVTLGLSDLGKRGNLAAIVVGQPPKVTSSDITTREDDDTSLHLEALYRYVINENTTITPGLIVITNPEHNDNNDTIYVGTIRTTFTF